MYTTPLLATLLATLAAVHTAPTSSGSAPTPIPTGAESASTAGNADLVRQLETASTAVDRLSLLSNDSSNFLYDFLNPPKAAITEGKGGRTVRSDRLQFPALVGTGVSMTIGFLGPCGFNTPHTHPRSSEINVAVQGSLVSEMIAENGASIVRHQLNTFQMTVFPQGALHTEFNPDCTNATFVAGFASEDPGVQQAAQTFLGLDDDLIAAVAGDVVDGAEIDMFRSMVPANVAMGVESCLAKCGIPKK